MNFALTDEQVMLREAAADALGRVDSVAAARAAMDGAGLPDLWGTARDAGWTGLLVPEDAGGAELGPFDAMLVAEQAGRRLASTGLLGHLCATELLRGDADAELAGRLASGEARAAAVLVRPATAARGWAAEGREEGERWVEPPVLEGDAVTGSVAFVPDAPGADVLVVVGESEDGIGAAIVAAGDAEVEPVVRYDATRPLAHVRFANAPARRLEGVGDAEAVRAWALAQAVLSAEALGGSEAMLELTVDYAKERQTFGRVIGSYQAVKHQLVEILRQAENVRSLTYYAGWAADDRPDEYRLAAASARFAAERCQDYASRTAIAIHGGIGATWEHDAPFYFRRAQLSRRLLGGASGAADEVAECLLTGSGTL